LSVCLSRTKEGVLDGLEAFLGWGDRQQAAPDRRGVCRVERRWPKLPPSQDRLRRAFDSRL